MARDDVKNAMEGLQKKFDSADFGDLNATYLFKLGEDGGDWTLTFEGGKGKISEGATVDNPSCTVTLSADDFLKIINKEADATQLFMFGKLKVKGNMGLAMKLQKILK